LRHQSDLSESTASAVLPAQEYREKGQAGIVLPPHAILLEAMESFLEYTREIARSASSRPRDWKLLSGANFASAVTLPIPGQLDRASSE